MNRMRSNRGLRREGKEVFEPRTPAERDGLRAMSSQLFFNTGNGLKKPAPRLEDLDRGGGDRELRQALPMFESRML